VGEKILARNNEVPNIILIMSDSHRWDFLGCEDNGRTITPRLNRIADEGVLFHQAYCPAPLCCPARQAIVSGRYPVNSGCFTNLHQLPTGTPTFLSCLRSVGYHTCAIGKTHMEIHAFDSDLTSASHRAYMDSLGWSEIHEISGSMMRTGIRCAYSEFLRGEHMLEPVIRYHRNWHYFMENKADGDPAHVVHEWPFEERFGFPLLEESMAETRLAQATSKARSSAAPKE